jgi:hypothetical protein
MRQCIVICFVAAFATVAAAHSTNVLPPVDWVKALDDQETFAATTLTGAEQKQVLDQVQATSFDTPDSWTDELRVRRISLGRTDGLVICGTRLLCGATGNCETWLFRRANGRWLNMFDGEAPVVTSVGFVKQTKNVRDVVATAHVATGTATWTQYAFDGRFYRVIATSR